MSFSNHMINFRNNQALRRKISYFKNKSQSLMKNARTGVPIKKFKVNKNAYQLTQERKASMFKKGLVIVSILLVSITIVAAITISLLS